MKILIIEDQQRLAHTLARGLRNRDFEVETAHTGNDGLHKIPEQKPDVIILDWMLPDISGIEVLQRLRANNDHTPVLMLTARVSVEDRVEGLDTGADDYLTKPFSLEELIARVSALARRPAQIEQKILQISDVVLNCQTKEVIRDGKLIHLSAKEFDLLEYLMRNAGMVKSEQEILDAVWDFAEDSLLNTSSNKVSVYIRYLRNKVDKPFPHSPDIITTVRGMGYKTQN